MNNKCVVHLVIRQNSAQLKITQKGIQRSEGFPVFYVIKVNACQFLSEYKRALHFL